MHFMMIVTYSQEIKKINTNCEFLDTLLGYMKFQKLEMLKLD